METDVVFCALHFEDMMMPLRLIMPYLIIWHNARVIGQN